MLPRRTPSEWLSSLPTLLVLLMAILMAAGETLHSRLLQIGQHTWDDYFRLRVADQRPEPLLPYVLIFAAVVLFFRVLLQRGLDEFSAPVILPLAMLAILAWERWADQEAGQAPPVKRRLAALERDIRGATSDATGHIGALLMLMALSVSMGGLIERSGMLDLLPATLPSIWLAMAALVVILVIVGMIMDPYGAVILVNATLAPLAFRNGIESLHFWLLTLVAFELGYLTPPVALNHLLTRQVVRHAQVPMAAGTVLARVFWRRHVRYVLPILVMGSTLLIVAFTPLLWPDWHDWLFVRIQVAH